MNQVSFEIDSAWPNPKYADLFIALLSQATTPAMVDDETTTLFLESFYDYITGDSQTLEAALDNYERVMRLKAEE